MAVGKGQKTKGQKTKENILVEALTLYAHKGVQNTSFQEIASGLGITQAALYKYFKNSDDLLAAGIQLGTQRGREFFASRENSEGSSQDQLLAHLKNNIEWCYRGKPFGFAFLALHFYKTQIPQIKKMHKEISEFRIQRLRDFLEKGNKDGSWRVQDSQALALTFHHLLLGEMLEAINSPRMESLEERCQRLERAALALLGWVR